MGAKDEIRGLLDIFCRAEGGPNEDKIVPYQFILEQVYIYNPSIRVQFFLMKILTLLFKLSSRFPF